MFRSILLVSLLTPTLANAACIRPEKPKFPDAKTATAEAVQKLDQEMQKYSAGTNAYVACLSNEAGDAQKDAAKTINFYNDQFLAAYNKRAGQ